VVEVVYAVEHLDRSTGYGSAIAAWQHNAGGNSYWRAEIGPLAFVERVSYYARGHASGSGAVTAAGFELGSGISISTALPEETARLLRARLCQTAG
jgi:hypothetical protein